MPSLKSVVFGVSTFHDGSVSAFESVACVGGLWNRLPQTGDDCVRQLHVHHERERCFQEWTCECGVMSQICLCLEALRLDLNRSLTTLMLSLRVFFESGCDGSDLPVLRSASFGFESFQDNTNVMFKSVVWEFGVME